jgi:hypothetical protein
MSGVHINGINDINIVVNIVDGAVWCKLWLRLQKSSLFDASVERTPRHRLRQHSTTPPRFGCYVAVENLSAQLNGFDRRSV